MAARTMVGVGLLLAAVLVAGVGVRAGSGEKPSTAAVPMANRCILCNTFGANQVPRICTTCNNKFNNRCILCNAFGANQMPRICTTCSNKFNNRCILCNTFGANQAPRICTTCNNKHWPSGE